MFETFDAAIDDVARDLAISELIDEGLSNWGNQKLVDANAVINMLLDLRALVNE